MTLSNSTIEARLKLAIAQKMRSTSAPKAKEAFNELSHAYRHHEAFRITGPQSEALLLSYAATRMPATFAVVSRVLQEYTNAGGRAPTSLVDIGAGPATASFAALDLFDDLNEITLIEKEKGFQDLALDLAGIAQVQPILDAKWKLSEMTKGVEIPSADLAIASYSLAEMSLQTAKAVAARAFASSALGLIIIEPGTPQGFAHVRDIRAHMLTLGA